MTNGKWKGLFCPLTEELRSGIDDAESVPLDVALRSAARHCSNHCQVAARLCRQFQPGENQGCLHTSVPELWKRTGAAQRSYSVMNRHHGAACGNASDFSEEKIRTRGVK